MAKAKVSEQERDDAAEKLRQWFPRGSTVYTVLRSAARSGMSREIGIVALIPDGDRPLIVLHPNGAVATLLGYRLNKAGDGLKVQGGGMDMGFAVAYELSRALYGDGYALNHRWL